MKFLDNVKRLLSGEGHEFLCRTELCHFSTRRIIQNSTARYKRWHRLRFRHPLVNPFQGCEGWVADAGWARGMVVVFLRFTPSSVCIQEIKRKRLSWDAVEIESSGCLYIWGCKFWCANVPMEVTMFFFFFGSHNQFHQWPSTLYPKMVILIWYNYNNKPKLLNHRLILYSIYCLWIMK